MLQSLLTYTRQRFNPLLFGPLALFLLLYALGPAPVRPLPLLLFALLLSLLYLFRLFDDLVNREVDAARPNRIYTQPAPNRQLWRFCLVFGILTQIWVGLVSLPAAFLLLGFLLLNGLGYYSLFHQGQWRYALPLFKYPFLCLLLMVLLSPGEAIALGQGLAALSLLPVFLLFEAFSDPSFSIGPAALIFWAISAHLLLVPAWGSAAVYLPLLTLAGVLF